ncbi:MAG: hypothetical protein PHW62_05080 [Candidatus Ratteibacteria bacterium]|nr:hypothetical protein [Candidatus Ratteibacteria bacterium]
MAKRGEKLVCGLCGREVIMDECGCSQTDMWCCDQPMKPKSKSKTKKSK